MPPEVTKNFAPQYSVFDAFCGWGGLSYGLALTGRFRTLLGNDILPEAGATFQHNHELLEGARPLAIVETIENLSAGDVQQMLEDPSIGWIASLAGRRAKGSVRIER